MLKISLMELKIKISEKEKYLIELEEEMGIDEVSALAQRLTIIARMAMKESGIPYGKPKETKHHPLQVRKKYNYQGKSPFVVLKHDRQKAFDVLKFYYDNDLDGHKLKELGEKMGFIIPRPDDRQAMQNQTYLLRKHHRITYEELGVDRSKYRGPYRKSHKEVENGTEAKEEKEEERNPVN